MGLLDVLKGVGNFAGDVVTGAAQASENLPAAMQTRYQNQLREQQMVQLQADRSQQQEAAQREQMFKSFDLLKTLAESGDIEGASALQSDLVQQGLLSPKSTFAASILGKKTKKKVAEVSEKYGGFFYDDGSFEAMPADVLSRVQAKPGEKWFDAKTGTIVGEDGSVIDLGESWRSLKGAEDDTGKPKEVGEVFNYALKVLDDGKVPPDVAMADAKIKLEIMGLSPEEIGKLVTKWEPAFAERFLKVPMLADERKRIDAARDAQVAANKIMAMFETNPQLDKKFGALFGRGGMVLSKITKEASRPQEESKLFFELDNLRDAVTRSRTGAAMIRDETGFYEQLLGSQLTSATALKARMDALIDYEQDVISNRYKTALGLRRGGTGMPSEEEIRRIPTFKKTYKPTSGVRTIENEVSVEEALSHKATKAAAADAGASQPWSVFTKAWKWDEKQEKYVPPSEEE